MNFMNEDWYVFWWNMSPDTSTSPVSQVWFCVIQAPFHILPLFACAMREKAQRLDEWEKKPSTKP